MTSFSVKIFEMQLCQMMMIVTSLLVYITSIGTVLSFSLFKSTTFFNAYRHTDHHHNHHYHKRLQVHSQQYIPPSFNDKLVNMNMNITTVEPTQHLLSALFTNDNLTIMSNSTPNHNHHQQQQQHQKRQFIRNNDTNNIRDLCVPLLDYKLIEDTILQWTRPLPTSYLSKPLVLVGPSGVGKGRLVRAILKDYSRFFQKVVTHTTR
jgi:hypothetical protein